MDEFEDLDEEFDLADDDVLQALDNVEKEWNAKTSRNDTEITEREETPAISKARSTFCPPVTKTLSRQTSLLEYNGQFSSALSSARGAATRKNLSISTDRPPNSSLQQPYNSFSFKHPRLPPNIKSKHKIDEVAISSWIYPTNVAIRDYQVNIVQTALYRNTLVSLPTGLGKTLIAAVVMFNFWRWFPEGKVVFMAPTKPLVAQQVEACFKVCGMPQDQTCELIGSAVPPATRSISWKNKRIFFLTPQIMDNDLKKDVCPADKIVCLVVDEAHRATGEYAYCKVVRQLEQKKNKECRIIALTATPGSNEEAIQDVVKNLRIAKIEIRTEESLDIRQYVHHREQEQITVPLGPEVELVKNQFSKVFSTILTRLRRNNAYHESDPVKVNKMSLMESKNRYTNSSGNVDSGTKFSVINDFVLCITLAQSMSLLLCHGIRSFYITMKAWVDGARANSLSGMGNKSSKGLLDNCDLTNLMKRLEHDILDPKFVSHPKLDRLIEIVLHHFTNQTDQGGETRVMIFTSYRESVDEIVMALSTQKPIIRAMPFVGQSTSKSGTKGLSQKVQLAVIDQFQKGEYNTLVATCIGEEGLDIGEVDLIICFDIQNSPIRMLQRTGRTGRRRQGKVVYLLAEEIETRKYQKSQETYRKMQRFMQDGRNIEFFDKSPRMVPVGISPVREDRVLEIPEYDRTYGKPPKRKSSGISKESTAQRFLTADELEEFERLFKNPFQKTGGVLKYPDLGMHSPLQERVQQTWRIGHSSKTMQFVNAIKIAEKFIQDDDGEQITKYEEWMKKSLYMEDLDVGIHQIDIEGSTDEGNSVKKGRKRKISATDSSEEQEDDDLRQYSSPRKPWNKLNQNLGNSIRMQTLFHEDDDVDLAIERSMKDLLDCSLPDEVPVTTGRHLELMDEDTYPSQNFAATSTSYFDNEVSSISNKDNLFHKNSDRHSTMNSRFRSSPQKSQTRSSLPSKELSPTSELAHNSEVTESILNSSHSSFMFDDDILGEVNEVQIHRPLLPYEDDSGDIHIRDSTYFGPPPLRSIPQIPGDNERTNGSASISMDNSTKADLCHPNTAVDICDDFKSPTLSPAGQRAYRSNSPTKKIDSCDDYDIDDDFTVEWDLEDFDANVIAISNSNPNLTHTPYQTDSPIIPFTPIVPQSSPNLVTPITPTTPITPITPVSIASTNNRPLSDHSSPLIRRPRYRNLSINNSGQASSDISPMNQPIWGAGSMQNEPAVLNSDGEHWAIAKQSKPLRRLEKGKINSRTEAVIAQEDKIFKNSKRRQCSKKSKLQGPNPFFDLEAQVSGSDKDSDGDEEGKEISSEMGSFIDDQTQQDLSSSLVYPNHYIMEEDQKSTEFYSDGSIHSTVPGDKFTLKELLGNKNNGAYRMKFERVKSGFSSDDFIREDEEIMTDLDGFIVDDDEIDESFNADEDQDEVL